MKAEALPLLEENLDSGLHGYAKGLSVSDTISPEIEANHWQVVPQKIKNLCTDKETIEGRGIP